MSRNYGRRSTDLPMNSDITRLGAIILAIVFAVAAIVQTFRLAHTTTTLAELRQSVVEQREARMAQAETQRELERYRNQAISKEVDRAFTDLEQARRDRDRAARLHARLVRLQRDAGVPTGGDRQDPAAAEGGEAAAGAGLVFPDLLGGSGERLRSCAAALDESRIAGRLCERAYDALTHGQEATSERPPL